MKRAEAFLGDRELLLERAIGGLSAARDQAERDRAALEKARAEAEVLHVRAKQKVQEAVEEKRAALEAGAREAADLVSSARSQLEAALADAKEKRVPPREAQRRLDDVHRKMAEKAQSLERPGTPFAPGEVKPGLAVRVRSLGREGTVVEVREKKRRAVVSCSGMEAEVPLDDLVRGEAPAPAAAPRPAPRAPAEAPREIDLRGLRVEEAVRKLGREVDLSLRAGLGEVRVIHGFGTGALGHAATDFLRRHPQVSHFRSGKPEEGGGGVLVVTFRD